MESGCLCFCLSEVMVRQWVGGRERFFLGKKMLDAWLFGCPLAPSHKGFLVRILGTICAGYARASHITF